MNWSSGLLWALLLTVALVAVWAMLEAACYVDWIDTVPEAGCNEGFSDKLGESNGMVERFVYSRRTGKLPTQRPAVALPGPSPNFSPLVNSVEKAVAQGNDSPIPGLSVTQHYGRSRRGLYSPDTQIDSRCRAACDADPTCSAYAVFNTRVDPARGLSGRGCRTYTNSMLYAPSTYPTLLATGCASPSQLERDGFPAPTGPATIYTKQFI